MPGQDIIIAVGLIGLAVSVSTAAAAIDVPGMTCSEVGSFAQRVAQQKATGVALNQAVPRLRRSFRREHADTEHELEKIVRAIYEMPIFSTVSPAEVGNAYRTACEKGQPRWSRENNPPLGFSHKAGRAEYPRETYGIVGVRRGGAVDLDQ